MTYVRTFDDAKPPATTNGVIFTIARLQEAPDVAGAPGAWLTIEDKAVAAYDTTAPPAMDFTTALATLETGWARIVWRTAAGAEFAGGAVKVGAGDVATRAQLSRITDATVQPLLTDEDLDELLEAAKRRDSAGRYPADTGYVATYDLNAAAAAGWLRKAGRAAAAYSYQVGSQRAERGQVHTHCLAMARMYARRVTGSIATKGTTAAAAIAAEAQG